MVTHQNVPTSSRTKPWYPAISQTSSAAVPGVVMHKFETTEPIEVAMNCFYLQPSPDLNKISLFHLDPEVFPVVPILFRYWGADHRMIIGHQGQTWQGGPKPISGAILKHMLSHLESRHSYELLRIIALCKMYFWMYSVLAGVASHLFSPGGLGTQRRCQKASLLGRTAGRGCRQQNLSNVGWKRWKYVKSENRWKSWISCNFWSTSFQVGSTPGVSVTETTTDKLS